MLITELLKIENNRRGYQEVCLDCEAYGLKKHRLTKSDCNSFPKVGHTPDSICYTWTYKCSDRLHLLRTPFILFKMQKFVQNL